MPIVVCVTVDDAGVDVASTAAQGPGNVNCPLSAAAAVYYVFYSLMPAPTPSCAGALAPVRLRAPSGSLVNARRPAAVAAGNVETSSRIVDAVLGAPADALPARIPAASHGSMNNVAMGGAAWAYYETIGGGGAHSRAAGQSGVQTHMTNTLNTPIEGLESTWPLRVRRYGLRHGSGGAGRHTGGDGLVREYEFLEPTPLTVHWPNGACTLPGGWPAAPRGRAAAPSSTTASSHPRSPCIRPPARGCGWSPAAAAAGAPPGDLPSGNEQA